MRQGAAPGRWRSATWMRMGRRTWWSRTGTPTRCLCCWGTETDPGTKLDFGTGTDPWSVAIGDMDGDGKPDLAVADGGSHAVSVLLGYGTEPSGQSRTLGPAVFPGPWRSAT